MKKDLFLSFAILSLLSACSSDSSNPVVNLDCEASGNYSVCQDTCKEAGGSLTSSTSESGQTDFYCRYPYEDAGNSCSNSEQCKGLCLLTAGQLDELNIPHRTDRNIFDYNGGIGLFSNKETWITNPLETIVLPSDFMGTGVCQDYPVENFRGVYEVNNGTATLELGSTDVN